MEQTSLECRLASGALDEALARLYSDVEAARARCAAVMATFTKTFSCAPEGLFSAPGRTEIGGNHTDHQHGHVLAAGVDLDMLAAAAPNQSGMIRVLSQGYPLVVVDLQVLAPCAEEQNTSAALIRGIAARMAAQGMQLHGAGADICIVSDVPGGSGLSSSAAFEVLIATVLNHLFCSGAYDPLELARIGQYAENLYFGKPCGLMDQTASAVGGVVSIDFADPAQPQVESIPLDLRAAGYALCILDVGAGHANLTKEYASIAEELRDVSGHFGKEVLRDVPEEAFLAALPQLRKELGDRAVLRAFHFYGDDRRARSEAQALKDGDFNEFLRLVRESGNSSAMYLQNVVASGQTLHQELPVTLALCQRILGQRGAARVHGGGFGGTAQAFVPLELLEEFRAKTEAVLGKDSCRVVTIRPAGGVRLA